MSTLRGSCDPSKDISTASHWVGDDVILHFGEAKMHLWNAKILESKMDISGILGACGDKEVFLAFASARDLSRISFADVLNEATGTGYQRRFSKQHSLDFRRYIQTPGSTTIPLTFNLRPESRKLWQLIRSDGNSAVLHIGEGSRRVLSQVDCQHRLGFLADMDIPLAVMIYIGLNETEEMSVFNVINAKSKGLSRSLTDYHELKLLDNVEKEKPELVVAIRLNQDPSSPWHMQLDIGGNRVSGMKRRASLRTMQKAVRRFIKETRPSDVKSIEELYGVIEAFWSAISIVLPQEWENPRKHFITKGIGVYALSSIAADLCRESVRLNGKLPDERTYIQFLERFISRLDWSSSGPLKGLGGEAGVSEAVRLIRARMGISQ